MLSFKKNIRYELTKLVKRNSIYQTNTPKNWKTRLINMQIFLYECLQYNLKSKISFSIYFSIRFCPENGWKNHISNLQLELYLILYNYTNNKASQFSTCNKSFFHIFHIFDKYCSVQTTISSYYQVRISAFFKFCFFNMLKLYLYFPVS